jgi:hypothetical protein
MTRPRLTKLVDKKMASIDDLGGGGGGTISSTHKYIEKGKTDILNTQIHKKR